MYKVEKQEKEKWRRRRRRGGGYNRLTKKKTMYTLYEDGRIKK